MNRLQFPEFLKEYNLYTEQLKKNYGNAQMIRGLAINLRNFISDKEQLAAQKRCPELIRDTISDGPLPSSDPDKSWQRLCQRIQDDIAVLYELLERYQGELRLEPTQYERAAFLYTLAELRGFPLCKEDTILKYIHQREETSDKFGASVTVPFEAHRFSMVAAYLMRDPNAIIAINLLDSGYRLSDNAIGAVRQMKYPWVVSG